MAKETEKKSAKKLSANKAPASKKKTAPAKKSSRSKAASAVSLAEELKTRLLHNFSVQPEDATDENWYNALALVLRDRMRTKRTQYISKAHKQDAKQVYYLCMEFLMGRSLKNTLFNLNLTEEAERVLSKYGVRLDNLYELEPDAGLGNGGLGRLAACFLDGLATASIPAIGYSLLYEYGIFRQKLDNGWQTEAPDFWLPGGQCWLLPRPELAKKVLFDGEVREWWNNGFHHVEHENATVIVAQPYDLMVAGKDGHGVSTLRLWKATAPSDGAIDMTLYNQGEYMRAMERRAMAEIITHQLYPSDNHREGKSLRLSQQYFLVSASVQDIVQRHLRKYGTLDNLPEMAAIHLNDTHPTLAIPELMRIMLDECGYSWEKAWEIITRTVAYTNHTVMAEALECWPEDLFSQRLPRIYQIVKEINNRFSEQMMKETDNDVAKVSRMAIISFGLVKMANLCVAASHSVNGVSRLHSEIIKQDVFHDAYTVMPEKFKNVTNGIAHRRWLCQANPELATFIRERLGSDEFVMDASHLEELTPFADDPDSLQAFMAIKRRNKERLAKYVLQQNGVAIDPDSIFDVQVKRLHEYKRQHLNALHILHTYLELKENPNMEFVPRTYLFGAKSAPGYFLAKEIIRFIYLLGKEIENDPAVRDKLKVVYLEDYRVSLAELLMPAADISEQISLAGTEASGTGNMKLMMNGAVTLGTMDGANVEIYESVGPDNIFIFGMSTEEVENQKRMGYTPQTLYNNNPRIHRALDVMFRGFGGRQFGEVAGSLTSKDPYMVLADFEDYCRAQDQSAAAYTDTLAWARKALLNTAGSGIFSSDRSIQDYSDRIWHCRPVTGM
ncbi:MAG: glycogen/starch/alpha-glucan family phosphorylase [Clostridia bacterium]|nr:glycogen/starch/alpha-glucan family phosphorylase [Clostridia bacterium]